VVVSILALPPVVANGQQAQPASSTSRFHAPIIRDSSDLKGPKQPIFFRHDIHAGEDQIPCMYCHYSAAISSEPGMPALQTCMGCHLVVGGGMRAGLNKDTAAASTERAQIQQVRTAWRDRKPPEWTRVYALPGFARFPHMRHIKRLGTGACVTCHGDVQTMPRVYQVASLRMGWCVGCHVKNNVSRDCSVCHY
jgi:Cytochrome c7 and related cytochrome c